MGCSAFGFPEKKPWFQAPDGGYRGGGFLAAFDGKFKMLQSGYFPGTNVTSVACRNGLIVIAGDAPETAGGNDKSKPDSKPVFCPTPVYSPLQPKFGGGKKDGWFAVFQVGR